MGDKVEDSGGIPSQRIFDSDGKVEEEEEYKGFEIDNDDQ